MPNFEKYKSEGSYKFSKGPKDVYHSGNDPELFSVVLNIPQQDDDDKWGGTERIAKERVIDEIGKMEITLYDPRGKGLNGLENKMNHLVGSGFEGGEGIILNLLEENMEPSLKLGDIFLDGQDGSITINNSIEINKRGIKSLGTSNFEISFAADTSKLKIVNIDCTTIKPITSGVGTLGTSGSRWNKIFVRDSIDLNENNSIGYSSHTKGLLFPHGNSLGTQSPTDPYLTAYIHRNYSDDTLGNEGRFQVRTVRKEHGSTFSFDTVFYVEHEKTAVKNILESQKESIFMGSTTFKSNALRSISIERSGESEGELKGRYEIGISNDGKLTIGPDDISAKGIFTMDKDGDINTTGNIRLGGYGLGKSFNNISDESIELGISVPRPTPSTTIRRGFVEITGGLDGRSKASLTPGSIELIGGSGSPYRVDIKKGKEITIKDEDTEVFKADSEGTVSANKLIVKNVLEVGWGETVVLPSLVGTGIRPLGVDEYGRIVVM